MAPKARLTFLFGMVLTMALTILAVMTWADWKLRCGQGNDTGILDLPWKIEWGYY